MTLHFQTKDLREAVASLQPVLSSKQTLPVLGAVEFSCSDRQDGIAATNTDVWMFCGVKFSKDLEVPFRVPGKLLHEALSRISAAECQISTTDSHAVLTAGSGRNKADLFLPLIVDPMPSLPEAEWSEPVLIEKLQEKLKTCLPFCSKALHRPELQSVYFGKGELIAADGRRCCWVKSGIKADSVVPAELCQLVARTEGDVQIRFAKSLAEFSGDGWTIAGKLLESTYPNTDSIRKDFSGMVIRSSARELTEAVSLAAYSLPVQIDSVNVTAEPDKLTFAAKGDNATEITCPAEVENPVAFGVSAHALESALQATASDRDEVELRFSDCHSFSISQNGTQVVCMLTRLT